MSEKALVKIEYSQEVRPPASKSIISERNIMLLTLAMIAGSLPLDILLTRMLRVH